MFQLKFKVKSKFLRPLLNYIYVVSSKLWNIQLLVFVVNFQRF